MRIKFGGRNVAVILVILVALFFTLVFGFTGLKTIIAVLFFFFAPFYLIIDNLNIPLGEKIIFSFFVGVGFFATFVYYLGFVLSSVKTAAIVSFVLLIAASVGIKLVLKKKILGSNTD